ncbi:hypothetical protein AB205_0218960 [Aquarana catesbeiana]|uniref:Uncharacterized protein n=1 Tax=Aquarana catesbeiana TaxID=8400 RepID=A0A2G9Q5I0_AQUCT|nr:hypothetical protein AB205_0218960 [Aquarana catesbeiana]
MLGPIIGGQEACVQSPPIASVLGESVTVSIPAFEREKIMYLAWNSAKTDNWKTLPNNVSYYYF